MIQRHTDCCFTELISGVQTRWIYNGRAFFLAIIALICHPVFYGERAVRLGDAPMINSVKRGARLQGRSEVRFLTFPPLFHVNQRTPYPERAGRTLL